MKYRHAKVISSWVGGGNRWKWRAVQGVMVVGGCKPHSQRMQWVGQVGVWVKWVKSLSHSCMPRVPAVLKKYAYKTVSKKLFAAKEFYQ